MRLDVRALAGEGVARAEIELVERKGIGHPDTICDSIVEAISRELSQLYLETAGRILHHNLDKALLVAGQSAPALAAGRMLEPMRFILGDRATLDWEGHEIAVADVVHETTARWLREHLPRVDPHRHLILENRLRPGSAALTDIFERTALVANDTSAGVGFAPRTECEELVLDAERFLNSRELKTRFPATGQDVKVMGVRRGKSLELTVAVAFIGAEVSSQGEYFAIKEALARELTAHLEARLTSIDSVAVALNCLDDPARGEAGMYLTVLGTSADGADSGQVGRGNRPGGLISMHRPMSAEAVPGKNAVSHVGKIYNVFAREAAGGIHAAVAGLDEVYVTLCSRIGAPVAEPWLAEVAFRPAPGVGPAELEGAVRDAFAAELTGLDAFVRRGVLSDVC